MVAEINNRKREHLKIVAENDTNYRSVRSGFERYTFVHNALPEIDLHDVELNCQFLQRPLSFPFLISPISGGEETGLKLNQALARVAQKMQVALGLGSIRPALVADSALSSYVVAREVAPDIPIIANLGAVQLVDGIDRKRLNSVLKSIGADALSVHLNPLQEALQPEGVPRFRNVSAAIEILKDTLPIPVIVKEVGFGLSFDVMRRLHKIGVKIIDIAGAGGTAWARIEGRRHTQENQEKIAAEFYEWGLPTAECLVSGVQIEGLKVIASGGVHSGMDYAKAIALGAFLGAAAAPFVRVWYQQGEEGAEALLTHYRETLRITMFGTGCRNLKAFRNNHKIILENEKLKRAE